MNYKTGQVYKINLRDGSTVTGRLERIFKENGQWNGYMEGIGHTVQLDELEPLGMIEQEQSLIPECKERLESIVYRAVQLQSNHWASHAAKDICNKLQDFEWTDSNSGERNADFDEKFGKLIADIMDEYNLDVC